MPVILGIIHAKTLECKKLTSVSHPFSAKKTEIL